MDAVTVRVGGVSVSLAEIAWAREILERQAGTAIRAPLLAAGHRLAWCDYHAVYQPFISRAGEPRGRGAAGRPAARLAFLVALGAAAAELELRQREADRDAALLDRFGARIARARLAFSRDSDSLVAIARAATRLQATAAAA